MSDIEEILDAVRGVSDRNSHYSQWFEDSQLTLLESVLAAWGEGHSLAWISGMVRLSRLGICQFLDSFEEMSIGRFLLANISHDQLTELDIFMRQGNYWLDDRSVFQNVGNGQIIDHSDDFLDLLRIYSEFPACLIYARLENNLQGSYKLADFASSLPQWVWRTRKKRNFADSRPQRRLEALASIRMAATFTYPVTGSKYEELQGAGLIGGPPRQSIMKLFGTWAEACREAGVESGVNGSRSYDLKWTNKEAMALLEECRKYFGRFPSLQLYEKWRQTADAPSAQTLKNRYGRWSELEDKFLEWKRTGNA